MHQCHCSPPAVLGCACTVAVTGLDFGGGIARRVALLQLLLPKPGEGGGCWLLPRLRKLHLCFRLCTENTGTEPLLQSVCTDRWTDLWSGYSSLEAFHCTN